MKAVISWFLAKYDQTVECGDAALRANDNSYILDNSENCIETTEIRGE